MSFTRPVTVSDRQHAAIMTAYRQAGLEPPTQTTAALLAIREAPGTRQVAEELVRDAFDFTGDPEAFRDQAHERIAAAQAADALREAVALITPKVLRERLPAFHDQAVRDLTPAFDKTVKLLVDAAAQLDPRAPLSLEAAVAFMRRTALPHEQQGQPVVITS
jgi:hypothetical protein